MIKIIIAEDQQLILKDLCNKISKIDDDINIVATAINGADAYEKIIDLRPDIVFTDINMPIMDGIQMIEKVKSKNIDTRFVVISGYKDFEYARAAIKVGVDEYLLKPILIEDIKKILNNLKSKISMKQNDYEQHIIDKLINSTVTDKPTINTNFDYKYYYVILFVAGPYSSFTIDFDTQFTQILNNIDLMNISKNYLGIDDRMFLTKGKNNNEMVGIWASNHDYSNNIRLFCDEVISICNEKDVFLTVGLSRPIKHIDNIGITSQIVRTVLKKKIVFSQSNILDCSKNDMYVHNHRIFLTDNIEKSIKFMVQNNQKDNFISTCLDLIKTLKENSATQLEIDKCLKSLKDICNTYILSEYNISDIDIKIDECISSSSNYDELSSNIKFIFNEFIDDYNKNTLKNNSMNDIIQSSKEYIKSHFSEDININDIASLFSVSPTYFSRLFKKEVGIPPVVYLTRYRLEKACEYFDNTEFTVKEVSELCGYSDPFYFSKAFKSIIGVSPKTYKSKIKA
ncbi:response regulator [Romboutsia weinsteinii]|uniref:Stage 0 sporulation protein A homolog n=1 Tax=Romboutsia weinsteinii TaxID=2020949 RepID=A0A371J8P1_9FIRM|nr:AraC family transcriptional regulator [Romboutsia weinsteinii]RDY29141.1 response regulator [Romboutsia weinsteinii]